jgi:hypothetical protein
VRHAGELRPRGRDDRRAREHRLERVARDVLWDGRRQDVERLREQIYSILVTVYFGCHELTIRIGADEQSGSGVLRRRIWSARSRGRRTLFWSMTESNSKSSIAAPLDGEADAVAERFGDRSGAAAKTCASVSQSASAFPARPDRRSTRRNKTATVDGDQEPCDSGLEETV